MIFKTLFFGSLKNYWFVFLWKSLISLKIIERHEYTMCLRLFWSDKKKESRQNNLAEFFCIVWLAGLKTKKLNAKKLFFEFLLNVDSAFSALTNFRNSSYESNCMNISAWHFYLPGIPKIRRLSEKNSPTSTTSIIFPLCIAQEICELACFIFQLRDSRYLHFLWGSMLHEHFHEIWAK